MINAIDKMQQYHDQHHKSQRKPNGKRHTTKEELYDPKERRTFTLYLTTDSIKKLKAMAVQHNRYPSKELEVILNKLNKQGENE